MQILKNKYKFKCNVFDSVVILCRLLLIFFLNKKFDEKIFQAQTLSVCVTVSAKPLHDFITQ